MSHSRTRALLVFALVLVGVTTFAVARVRTANSRTLPYHGFLERDGARVSGPITARFGLFTSSSADTSCVVSNDCPVWSEEQDIDVVDGTFSVLLGEGGGRPLTSAVLQSPELFIAVAVKAGDDDSFTALSGLDEVIPAALLQPGAVTARSLDTSLFFSANINFIGNNQYRVSEQFPSDWIPGSIAQVGAIAQIFTRQTFGVTNYKCTATPLGSPRLLVIEGAVAGGINVGVYNGAGASSPGSFTLMCHGF